MATSEWKTFAHYARDIVDETGKVITTVEHAEQGDAITIGGITIPSALVKDTLTVLTDAASRLGIVL
jgi:acetaldehyde dehydrogenase (acetylating)